jgi:hypothetical protein
MNDLDEIEIINKFYKRKYWLKYENRVFMNKTKKC